MSDLGAFLLMLESAGVKHEHRTSTAGDHRVHEIEVPHEDGFYTGIFFDIDEKLVGMRGYQDVRPAALEDVRARFLGLLATRLPSYVFPIQRSPVLERHAGSGAAPFEWMIKPLRQRLDYQPVGRRALFLDVPPEKPR